MSRRSTRPWENIPVAQYIVTKYWDTDGNGFADSQIDITGDGVNDLNYFANLLGTSVQKAEVKGVEIETNWRATDNMRVNLNVGFLDTKYKELGAGRCWFVTRSDRRLRVCTGSSVHGEPGPAVLGSRGGSGLTPRLDYTYTDDFTLTPNEQNQRIQKGFGLLNARVTYDSGSNWSVSALAPT